MSIDLDSRLNNGRQYGRGELVVIDPCSLHARPVNEVRTFDEALRIALRCNDCEATA